ncbi:MAG TPA: hypothetical protein PLH15_02770 [Spirochaetota bacterium]|nr:hypothetical protein [Spirochaetota bacterium]HQO22023.1 hypothetical protein [Spirochaetota bacterium]HQQ22743.1 hypothetical protein [Spirochaetota bacterium]
MRFFLSERVYCTADLGLNAFYSVNGDLDLLYGDVSLLFGFAVKI